MLGALSGCEKEKSATEPVYNPISRLDAEVLLKQWNAERKGRLKSATTLNLTEEQWGRAKVYLSEEEGRSLLTLPLAPGLRLCFGKAAGKAELFFCETRPDSAYLRQVAGKVEGAIFTGYLILYNQQGAGVVAYRYTDGGYEGAYHVMPRVCTLKDMTTDMQYIETVVVTGKWMKKPQPQACVSETDSPGGFGYTSNLRIDANVGDCWSGGGSSGKPDPKPEKRDLTVDEKAALNKAKEAVKEKGCGASMAYEMVSANWSRYSYQVDPNLKGQAGYLNGTFYFNNASTIDARYLTEEFIHAAQDLVYPNGINGLSRPNIEFEAKFLVEINNLYEGWCCDKSLLLPGLREDLSSQLKKWIANGDVNLNEYNYWLEKWCNEPSSQYYGKENLIDRGLAPFLIQKFIKDKSSCLK